MYPTKFGEPSYGRNIGPAWCICGASTGSPASGVCCTAGSLSTLYFAGDQLAVVFRAEGWKGPRAPLFAGVVRLLSLAFVAQFAVGGLCGHQSMRARLQR